MKQIHEAVQALDSDIGLLLPSWLLLKKLKNAPKITGQIPWGQCAYCQYLEIIRAEVYS